MAADSHKSAEDDAGEFADFMADISEEIAQRVESLVATPKIHPETRRKTPAAPDAGLILEWENIADRIIEDMR